MLFDGSEQLWAGDQHTRAHAPALARYRASATRKSASSSMSHASSGGLEQHRSFADPEDEALQAGSAEQVETGVLEKDGRQVLGAEQNVWIVVDRPGVLVPQARLEARNAEERVVVRLPRQEVVNGPGDRFGAEERIRAVRLDVIVARTRCTSLSSTSFIDTMPPRSASGRSITRTPGKLRSTSSLMRVLSVSMTASDTRGQLSSDSTTWWKSGFPPSNR